MYIIISLLIAFLLLFVYSACVVSGRCSREEEKRELEFKKKEKQL